MTEVLGESNAQPKEKATRSRLVIDKLALINFKSFAGTQVIGPFHKVSTRIQQQRKRANTHTVILINRRTKR